MIDRETVDRIYAAANIVDIIGEYVTLKRKGVNYVACCPFHNEKTPSFVVSPSKGLYKCFGCGKGGNAVTFVMDQEATTYAEALKMVAKRYGIEVKEEALTEEEVRRNDDRESMFALNGWAAEYFANYLHRETEGQSVGLAYFRQKRGMHRRHDPEIRTGILSRQRRPDVEGRPGGGLQAGVSRLDGAFAATRERRVALRPLPRPRDLPRAQHFGAHRGVRRPHAAHRQAGGQVPELPRERDIQQETRTLRSLFRQEGHSAAGFRHHGRRIHRCDFDASGRGRERRVFVRHVAYDGADTPAEPLYEEYHGDLRRRFGGHSRLAARYRHDLEGGA